MTDRNPLPVPSSIFAMPDILICIFVHFPGTNHIFRPNCRAKPFSLFSPNPLSLSLSVSLFVSSLSLWCLSYLSAWSGGSNFLICSIQQIHPLAQTGLDRDMYSAVLCRSTSDLLRCQSDPYHSARCCIEAGTTQIATVPRWLPCLEPN